MIQSLPIHKLLRREQVVGKGRPRNQNIQTLYFCEVCGTGTCLSVQAMRSETKHIVNKYFVGNVDLTFLNQNRFQKTFNYQIKFSQADMKQNNQIKRVMQVFETYTHTLRWYTLTTKLRRKNNINYFNFIQTYICFQFLFLGMA